MGKREAAGDSSRRAKKHKLAKPPPATSVDDEDVDVEGQEPQMVEEQQYTEDAPAVEHEEEIVCDGEVEMSQVDYDNDADADFSIDVEDEEVDEDEEEEDETVNSMPVTPTPTPPKSSKAAGGGEGSAATKKSSASKLIATPTIPEAASPKPSTSAAAAAAASAAMGAPSSANAKKSKKRRDSGTSSDEERWLTAIESGKLIDVDDELKKIKDPKLMTARQRAMYERNDPVGGSELLMSLPTGYREKEKPQTAEDIQKAALKSQKRKQLADAKREKDKRRTMDRLLKKQESRQRSSGRGKGAKAAQPMISYRNSSATGVCIQMPPGIEFPLRAQVAPPPPKVQLCGIAGCGQRKVYNCSKTNLPLCSFACYRKNVQAVRQIMC